MAEDLVLAQLRAIREDISGLATREDISGLATKDDLEASTSPLSTRAELEELRSEMLRHFVDVETRLTTEVHELIGLLKDLVRSRDRLASRVSELERDVAELKQRAG